MSAHITKVNICIERLKALAERLDEAGFEADNPIHQAGFWMEREAIEVLLAYVTKLRGQVEGQPCPTCARLRAEVEAMREVVETAWKMCACLKLFGPQTSDVDLIAALERLDAITKEKP